MSTNFGNALTGLVLQPGSSFTITRSGFDTGTRTYKCDSSVVGSLVPERGTADETYPGMLVDSVAITEETLGVATVTVTYVGNVSESAVKPDEFTYTVNYEPNGVSFTTTINGTSTTVDTSIYHPQVTHTYVAVDLPESEVGDYIDPPKFAELVPAESFTVPETNQTWTYVVSYKGWKLAGRTIRDGIDAYEISDTYTYDMAIASVTVTT